MFVLMNVLATTLCYPNPARPAFGIFVKRRLASIHQQLPLSVVAPVPVCPPIRPRGFSQSQASASDVDSPPVWWPSMFYLPGICKWLDSQFYADSFAHQIFTDDRLSRADLIDAHFVWPDGVGAWRVAQQRQLPFICTIRGKLVSQIRHRRIRRQIIDMLLGADRLIAVSQSLANLAQVVARHQLDIQVIPNGIDSGMFFFEPTGATLPQTHLPNGWEASYQHVISVGHLQKLKGFHRLIEIWPAVCERNGPAQLILVGGSTGETDYEAKLHQMAQTINREIGGPAPAVIFAGALWPESLRRLLNAVDLFALASDSEGWCNSIAEALACGCPVVATDVGGNSEQVSNPDLGALTPLDDSTALTNALVTTLRRDFDRRAVAEFGQRRSWSDVATECVDVFSSLTR